MLLKEAELDATRRLRLQGLLSFSVAVAGKKIEYCLVSLQVGSTGRFSILEQGLLINKLTQQDAGLYQCQGTDSSFSQILTYYKLRIIGEQAMEAVTSRLSKNAETKGNRHSITPVSGLQLHYKGYSWAPDTNLVEFCNALQQRKRLRQKVWTWQQHPSESKKGRVRRQPGSRREEGPV